MECFLVLIFFMLVALAFLIYGAYLNIYVELKETNSVLNETIDRLLDENLMLQNLVDSIHHDYRLMVAQYVENHVYNVKDMYLTVSRTPPVPYQGEGCIMLNPLVFPRV